jgi:dienelactone hydrolase
MKILHTPSAIRFGLLGEKGAAPAPTLFVFAQSVEGTLESEVYNKAGLILSGKGYLCVSLDLPCHGEDRKASEPEGLSGWRARMEKGDNLVTGFTAKASAVLDFLIQQGCADPQKVAACGTSRGGFIALHFAAADSRVRCVAAFAPVTDLLTLREFAGMEDHATTKASSVINHAEKLAGRAVWVCIGNNDERVGTDNAIALARKVTAASLAQNKPANVELHVMPTIGHQIHATAHDEAAAWTLMQMRDEG